MSRNSSRDDGRTVRFKSKAAFKTSVAEKFHNIQILYSYKYTALDFV